MFELEQNTWRDVFGEQTTTQKFLHCLKHTFLVKECQQTMKQKIIVHRVSSNKEGMLVYKIWELSSQNTV